MRIFQHTSRPAALFALLACVAAGAGAQEQSAAGNTDVNGGYSDSVNAKRSRTTTTSADVAAGRRRQAGGAVETDPARILRAARTVYVRPNDYVDADYLEYKLARHPEFQQWRLAFVKDPARADLVLEVRRTALNYIFSLVDADSSVVVAKGKVVAINGLVAAEDISKEILKRVRAVRALPVDEP